MRQLLQGILAYTCILFIQCTTAQAQQVWTYDFGVLDYTLSPISSIQSDEGESLPLTTQNLGGTARVRTGTNSGAEVKFIDRINGSVEIGTFHQLELNASIGGSENAFSIHEFSGTEVSYLGFEMFITSEEAIYELFFGGGASFGENSGQINNSIVGLIFEVNQSGELLTRRRTTSSISGSSDIDIFETDTRYKVQLFANNSSTDNKTYHVNGSQYQLNADGWDLWVNGELKLNNVTSGALSDDFVIDGFMFTADSSPSNLGKMYIDDIVYSNTLPDIRTIEGEEGWRMLASPMNGTNIDQFARQNLVQGVAGSYESDESNIFTSHQGQDETNDPDGEFWSAPSGLNTTVERGKGFIWYLYDNAAVPESKPLPMDVVIAKNQTPGDVQVSLNTQNQGWNILGNPFSEDLRVDDIAGWPKTGGNGELVSNNVQVWNSSLSTYEVLGGSSGDKVASVQGFFLQTDGADELTIPESAVTPAGDSPFYKNSEKRGIVAFEIRSENENSVFLDKALKLYFGEDAKQEWDMNDAEKLTPLSDTFISAGFIGTDRFGEAVVKAQDSRSISLRNPISIPLNFTASGLDGLAEFTMVQVDDVVDEFIFEIEDLETGVRQRMSKGIPFQFQFSQTLAAKVVDIKRLFDETPYKLNSKERFLLHIFPDQDIFRESVTPEHFTLHQNYPNPFNPTTQIAFELPEQSLVKLEVYDMLGRQVATLVDGSVAAGIHYADFNASNLSSGVYVYRLVTSHSVHTKKLTVLK